jgi:prophage maintenance system killer protein
VIHLDLPGALAIAAHVLGCTSETIVDLADVDGIETTLAEARSSDAADVVPAAAALLVGFVRRRPYPRRNRRIALVTTLQFLALNGWDLDLDDVADVNQLLELAAAGGDSEDLAQQRITSVTDRLRSRIRPLATGRPTAGAETTVTDSDLGGFMPHGHGVLTTEGRSGGMFERFTDRARRATVLAQEEARLLNHAYIGTEHILLGLIREGDGVAAKAIEGLGLSIESVRAQVEGIVGKGVRPPSGHVPFTPRSKKVLELALRESIQLGHNYIGTEHILLGLIREGAGVAAQVMVKLGVGLDAARASVREILADGGGHAAAEPSDPADLAASVSEHAVAAAVREALRSSDLAGGRRDLLLREVSTLLDDNDRLQAERDQLAGEVARLRGLLRKHDIDPES